MWPKWIEYTDTHQQPNHIHGSRRNEMQQNVDSWCSECINKTNKRDWTETKDESVWKRCTQQRIDTSKFGECKLSQLFSNFVSTAKYAA